LKFGYLRKSFDNFFGFFCAGSSGAFLGRFNPCESKQGVHLAQSYLFFECELDRIVDGFGENSLVVGRIVEAAVAQDSLRTLERDAQDLIHHAPMLAYLQPWRFASIEQTYRFPLPDGFER